MGAGAGALAGAFAKVAAVAARSAPEPPKAAPSPLPSRPCKADGTFLRVITVNDSYTLANYPRVASAVRAARALEKQLDCVVVSVMNGDFLSPSQHTALDGGHVMVKGLNYAQIDFLCLGNHEFDVPQWQLKKALDNFQGTILNSNAECEPLSHLPKFAKLAVGGRAAVLVGLCIADPSIYLPSHGFSSLPIFDAAVDAWNLSKGTSSLPDLFLPLTHQFLAEDRTLAQQIGCHEELKSRTPAIFGGHEHDLFVESVGPTTIVKVGQDCERLGVVDIWWTADGRLEAAVQVLETAQFDLEPEAQRFVTKQEELLRSLAECCLASLPGPLSSQHVRFEHGGLASHLMTLVRRGLARERVDVAVVQAGDVRGRRDYAPGPFMVHDLFTELAFENPQAITQVKGSILAETLRATHADKKPSPRLIHFDEGVKLGPDLEIVEINGAPFDPDKLYTVAAALPMLEGLDGIEPLHRWVQDNSTVPDVEMCRPVKEIVINFCMKTYWRRLVGCEHWDELDPQKLHAAAEALFGEMDANADGRIGASEVDDFIIKKMAERGERGGASLLQHMFRSLDFDRDGNLSIAELKELAL